jgi:hypothetical protein
MYALTPYVHPAEIHRLFLDYRGRPRSSDSPVPDMVMTSMTVSFSDKSILQPYRFRRLYADTGAVVLLLLSNAAFILLVRYES